MELLCIQGKFLYGAAKIDLPFQYKIECNFLSNNFLLHWPQTWFLLFIRVEYHKESQKYWDYQHAPKAKTVRPIAIDLVRLSRISAILQSSCDATCRDASTNLQTHSAKPPLTSLWCCRHDWSPVVLRYELWFSWKKPLISSADLPLISK
jgi:hypothetical protein